MSLINININIVMVKCDVLFEVRTEFSHVNYTDSKG
jgi:hypothetical protein